MIKSRKCPIPHPHPTPQTKLMIKTETEKKKKTEMIRISKKLLGYLQFIVFGII